MDLTHKYILTVVMLVYMLVITVTIVSCDEEMDEDLVDSVEYYNRFFLGLEEPYVPEMIKIVESFNGVVINEKH